MMRKIILLIVTALVLVSCDKGLSPPEILPLSHQFPLEPLGVNPIGNWSPRERNPVDLTILDDSQIPDVLDSMRFEITLDGNFEFKNDGDCSVAALMTIDARVYLQEAQTPLQFTFPDSITGEGPYYILDDTILQTPIQSTMFQLDTLGFTSSTYTLDLISLPNVFSYLGIIDILVYFVFHLEKDVEGVLGSRVRTITMQPKRGKEG